MPRALSLDLRERVLAAIAAGTSCRQAAGRFGVGPATAVRWQARFRAEGAVAAKPMGGDQCSARIEAHAAAILRASAAQPQAYLRELRDRLREQGIHTSTSGLHRFFVRHGITRKKGRSTPASRTVRT
jgi:transposase